MQHVHWVCFVQEIICMRWRQLGVQPLQKQLPSIIAEASIRGLGFHVG